MKKKINKKLQTSKIRHNFTLLLGFCLGTVVLGSIGSIFTMPAIPVWYAWLNKPGFSPPNWLFGPVWTILFIMMGSALYLVYRRDIKNDQVRDAVIVYVIQFFFNLLWSFLFFGLRSPAYGLAGIFVLWISIAATIKLFYQIEKTAAYLLIPYICWVSFAAILNAAIYILN